MNFLFGRRFNWVDLVVVSIAAQFLHDGHWLTAGIIMAVGLVVSIIGEKAVR